MVEYELAIPVRLFIHPNGYCQYNGKSHIVLSADEETGALVIAEDGNNDNKTTILKKDLTSEILSKRLIFTNKLNRTVLRVNADVLIGINFDVDKVKN